MTFSLRFLLICSLLGAFLPLSAQLDFAPVGARYSYLLEIQSGPDNQYSDFRVVHINVTGDTLIQDKNCRILAGEGVTVNWVTNCGVLLQDRAFVYEEDGEVYYYHAAEDAFHILYDFNAGPGTSWPVDIDCAEYELLAEITEHTVDSVTTEIVEGLTFDVQYVQGRKIYRNIGLDGPFFFYPNWYGTTAHSYLRSLRCYSDPAQGEFHFHEDFGDCDTYVTATEEPAAARSLRVFPNPAGEVIQVEAEEPFRWVLYDAVGRSVSISQTFKNAITLNTSNLLSGIYTIRITFLTGDGVTRRVVVR